LQLFA
jgi:hypothetical protein